MLDFIDFGFDSYEVDNGCWIWQDTTRKDGYGVLFVDKKMKRAHRVSFEHFTGPITAGMQVLHKCDVRGCVNPEHLFLGTDADNHQDKARKGRHWQQKKIHCPKGHPYDLANTYWVPGTHSRKCRICRDMPPVNDSTIPNTEDVSLR